MTNEQLLLEIGRVMGQAIQESEERLKLYVHDVVQASEERMKVETDRLSQQIQEVDARLFNQIQEVDARLSTSIGDLRETVQQAFDDTEKMARQIAATIAS